MRRLALISLALVLCGCGGYDAATGVNNPESGLLTPSTVFTRVDLGTLGGAFSYAADINGADVVVGWSETAAGGTHAFRWTAAKGMVDLGTLPGHTMSRAVAILDGDAAAILGMSGVDGRWTPVSWSASGSVRPLPITMFPNSTMTLPADFNSRGDVVGSDAGALQHAWIWSQTDGKHDLSANVEGGSNEGNASAITESGLVVLTARASTCKTGTSCWRSYVWSKASGYRALGTLDNGPDGSVTGLGLNESGSVVGWASSGTVTTTPYSWTPGKGFTRLANYSIDRNPYGYATAINSSGIVVGADREPVSGSIVASAWVPSGEIVRLSPDDPYPSIALALNSSGVIAGWAELSSGDNHAVIWKRSSQSSRSLVQPLTSVSARIRSATAACLSDSRSITSRQRLFACAGGAEMSSRTRSAGRGE